METVYILVAIFMAAMITVIFFAYVGLFKKKDDE